MHRMQNKHSNGAVRHVHDAVPVAGHHLHVHAGQSQSSADAGAGMPRLAGIDRGIWSGVFRRNVSLVIRLIFCLDSRYRPLPRLVVVAR